MKSGGLLHPEILALIARAGHGDLIVIADVGLPIPKTTLRIDLAVTPGLPDLISVVKAVQAELVIESITIAQELPEFSPDFYNRLSPCLSYPTVEVDHEALKAMLPSAAAVIRTGEVTPYANVVIRCGVNF